MNKLTKVVNSILNGSIVIILVGMVSLVFLNAVLRYLFDSGITWSEEMARYLFVWLVFLGAIVALKERGHIIVDLLVANVSKKLQKIFFLISNILIIGVLCIFIDGSSKLIILNEKIMGPATGLPKNLLYIAGLVAAISMILISLYQTIRFLFFNDKPEWVKDDDVIGKSGENS
jgi:TRAP-type C4-dicarboxylate transport system permease small subunit